MDDQQHSVPAPGRAKGRRVAADGILGRMTYTPAPRNEEIGQLRRNRVKDDAPGFKQVVPFTQWCPPTKTATSKPSDMRPSQAARSQKHWLLTYFPEAAIQDEAIESLLLDEITACHGKPPAKPLDAAALFSVGEVTDLRESESVKGHPVLALASGVSGSVLRLISLAREDWVWFEADIRVRLQAVDSQLGGEWSQDGIPISLVRFAVDARKYDPIRWLLVQNGTSTTVYEPELRSIPMPAAGTTAELSGRSVVSQMFANPLVTITCDCTGGSLQTDISFARNHETDTPQLAIIDQAGYWSVWDVTGRRNARPKNLTPVLRMCGNVISGFIPKLPSSSMAEPQFHQILWLSLGQNTSRPPSRALSRTRSQSELSRPSAEPGQELTRRVLLMCNPKVLHLFDLASHKLHSVTHLVLPKENHCILGIAPSRLDPAQAFVLTTTNLLWVAAREGNKRSALTLDVLASCPHQKDTGDDDATRLRLDVSPGAYLGDRKACFVCVRSARDAEMAVFWFVDPEPDAPAMYHRDTISLRNAPGFVGLSILPAGRRVGGEEPASAAGRAMKKAQLRFFQLVTLGQDLDVHSALCAWSDEPGAPIPPPDTMGTLEEGGNRRLKLLQSLTDAFAVPDEFDERVVFGRKGADSTSWECSAGGIQRRVVDFGLVAQRLSTAAGLPSKKKDDRVAPMDHVDFGFIGKAVEREKEDGYMPRHSLLDLAAPHQADNDLLRLAREWDFQQEALHRRTGDWLFVPEARRPLVDFGPDDLLERLTDMFPEPQLTERNPVREKRKEVLQNMAAEVFLSNIGISAVPESWTGTGNSLPSSLPFPSSPSLMPSSQLSLPSFIKKKGKKVKGEEEEPPGEEQGDTVALRLRKYATLNTSPTIHGEPPIALSRWDLGADPDDNHWKPGQDIAAESAIAKRRRKIEARRRKAERLSQRLFGEDSMLVDQSSQSLAGGPTSQPLPMILSTGGSQRQSLSQNTGFPFSSQQQHGVMGFGTPRARPGSPLRREYRRDSGMGVASSSQQQQQLLQGTPSQPKSQVLPGLFGGRPSFSPFKRSPLKKGKRKSELRMSGFR